MSNTRDGRRTGESSWLPGRFYYHQNEVDPDLARASVDLAVFRCAERKLATALRVTRATLRRELKEANMSECGV